MMSEIQDILVGGVLSVVFVIVGIFVARIEKVLKEKFSIEIEAKHREALHSALQSGARIAVLRAASSAGVYPRESVRNEVEEYLRKSVPDALRKLTPDPDVLSKLIDAALEKTKNE